MKSPFFVLQVLIICNCFIGSYLQTTQSVWFSSFESDESDLWNVTSNNIPFQRVNYSNISIPPHNGDWVISAQGANKELLLPLIAYYGGNILLYFYAYVKQPSILTVRFLCCNSYSCLIPKENYSVVKSKIIRINANGWTMYSYTVSHNDIQYPDFLVSFIYSSNDQIYLDSIRIAFDGSIISCLSITKIDRCGFSTDVFGDSGWSFEALAVKWITSPASTYLKRDFLYLGGLLTGSMNFKGFSSNVIIQISVNQTSYQQQISSGQTNFDLTAFTQYTVGQTYTILITFITNTSTAQLSSFSMSVAGDCSKCHAVLNCNQFKNGVTCTCRNNSCPSPTLQCIVSKVNQSINPCICLPGYTADSSGYCIDINECISNQPPCSWRNGVCTNTNGSYFCSCLNEWMMGQDNASCVDKCNNKCIYMHTNETYTSVYNNNGIYTNDKCHNGSQLNSNLTECFDVSECIKSNNCSWNVGVCSNSFGRFKCLCHDGWALTKTNDNCAFPYGSIVPSSKYIVVPYIPLNEAVLIISVVVYVCQLPDINAVVNLKNFYPVGEFNPQSTKLFTIGDSSSKTSRKKRSVNYNNAPLQEGAVYVVFYIGFTSDGQRFTSPISEPIVTVDPSSPCGPKTCFSYKNQTCVVINSTYAKCHCKNGFISFDNGLTCEDIDECSSVANTCNFKNSQCTNLIGSSKCSCMEGYKLGDSQDSCVDINECETLCKAPNTTCKNTPGSYECFCNIFGSFYNTTLNVCLDLNECSMSNQPCDPVRGICTNQNVFETGITYTCFCPNGYELSKDGSNSCLDIDECSTLCKGVNALCINTIGSYKCSCAVGFSLNSSSQCQLNNSCNCPLNSYCTMNSSFDCTCNPGYSKNILSNCQANDQCLGTTNCMKPHQVCQNNFANLSYTCLCRSGYEKVGEECKAINVSVCNLSSINNISLCPFDQQCYDTNSGFECRCQPGYVKNNLGYCQDINECEENISACLSNAYCTNTNGSYYCQCNKGFIGENVFNSSMMHCYTNSTWSSWEQIGTCSESCSTDEKQGSLKFQRFCKAVNFSSCNDEFLKEEVCNSELCDNKIKILKSSDCEKWSNMQANVSDQSFRNNETWINKIRAWGGWKEKACGPSLNDVSKFVNQDIENITAEIIILLADRNALRKAIDWNAYIQRKNSLKTQYVTIYSRLAMYTAFDAALNKLKSRIDMKLNECTRGLSAIYF